MIRTSFSELLRNILPSPKVAEERLEQAKQWGFSLFKESLEKFCDDGGFIFQLLLVLLIFVFSSSSTYIKNINIYIKAKTDEPASSTRR